MGINKYSQIWSILEFEHQRAMELEEVLTRMKDNCRLYLDYLQKMRASLETAGYMPVDDAVYSIGDRAADTDAKNLGDIEDLIEILLSRPEEDTRFSDNMICAPQLADKNIWGIFDGTRLILHTPLLPPGGDRSKYYTHRNKYAPSADYGHAFTEGVNGAMCRLLPKIPLEVYQRFAEKMVSMIYIFPKGKRQLPDNDRYDTKAIIDAVTGFLPGGDEARGCTLTFQTVVSDTLEEGTYIIVSPGKYLRDADVENDLKALQTMRKNDDFQNSGFRIENRW